jgi:ubiquitin thioesterase OTU1
MIKIKVCIANSRLNSVLQLATPNPISLGELKKEILSNTVLASAICTLLVDVNKTLVLSTGVPLKRLPEGRDDEPISEFKISNGSLVTLSIENKAVSIENKAISTLPELPSVSSWTCSACTLINSFASLNCSTCGAESPFSNNTRSHEWACFKCTYVNKGGFLCEICGDNKPPIEEELTFKRLEIPSDNSCLFHAVGLISGLGGASKMRKIAAELIDKDSSTFSDAILGQPREKYKSWILEKNSWGGAIELGVLSAALGIELVAIEVRGGHVYTFGQGSHLRGYLVFDGVHYDVIYASNKNNSVSKYLFKVIDEEAYKSALAIVEELRRLRQFVDTTNFTIVCGSCNLALKGEAEARGHATTTGHTDFREVKS